MTTHVLCKVICDVCGKSCLFHTDQQLAAESIVVSRGWIRTGYGKIICPDCEL